MPPYVPATQQLVAEIFVRDIERSKAFYGELGFTIEHDRGRFVVLSWEDHELYLDARDDLGQPPATPQVNIRIMVPDVDQYWVLAQMLGFPVYAPIDNRSYGLRDFTVLDPDGVGLRFGSRILISSDGDE